MSRTIKTNQQYGKLSFSDVISSSIQHFTNAESPQMQICTWHMELWIEVGKLHKSCTGALMLVEGLYLTSRKASSICPVFAEQSLLALKDLLSRNYLNSLIYLAFWHFLIGKSFPVNFCSVFHFQLHASNGYMLTPHF